MVIRTNDFARILKKSPERVTRKTPRAIRFDTPLFHGAVAMQKTILKFGFLAGAILAVAMITTLPFLEKIVDWAYVLGYTTMVLAFLMTYFGVRSYRDTVGRGSVTFGRALLIGAAITGIASCCYVATWEVIYYKFTPDFAEKYAARQIEKTRASGASAAALAKTEQEMEQFKAMYKNPVSNVAMTFLEPLPVGIVMTLVAAGMLKRRPTVT